ncbi:MAG: carboxypeptidase regulatory-like domain-containing protein [Acidobacteria bacterium]|nr:carboxypeptidase regulatory-like domain-containing protein [Acidobacteriota bacterium]
MKSVRAWERRHPCLHKIMKIVVRNTCRQGCLRSQALTVACAPLIPILFLVIVFFLFAPSLKAQSGGILKGRVVAEDGSGLPNVTVSIGTVGGSRSSRPRSTLTDEEGRFEFTDLPYTRHLITVMSSGVYVQPVPEPGMRAEHLPGENITITMIRGGVITGRVTGSAGEPIIGIQVSAIRVRNEDGSPIRITGAAGSKFTDDRGIYRLYGLQPGTYLVVANFGQRNNFTNTPFDGETPTFHPASTRDTAAEVTVSAGGEVGGIDIRYRGDSGHIVSGTITGPDGQAGGGAMAYLLFPDTGISAGLGITQRAGDGFEIQGIADGEYDMIGARDLFGKESGYLSDPRKIIVRGSDVTGINLRLMKLATVEGTLSVDEEKDSCPGVPALNAESVIVSSYRDPKSLNQAKQFFLSVPPPVSLDPSGRFVLPNIFPGRNRLHFRIPEGYFIRSISQAAASTGRNAQSKPVEKDLSSEWIDLKFGEKLSGLKIVAGKGAGTIEGRVTPEKDGGRLPSRLTIHLIPAEKEAVNEVQRYAEMPVRADRSFAFSNLAPGMYKLLVRQVPADQSAGWPGPLTALDPLEREKLRKEADVRPFEIELKPCQRVSDLIIRF